MMILMLSGEWSYRHHHQHAWTIDDDGDVDVVFDLSSNFLIDYPATTATKYIILLNIILYTIMQYNESHRWWWWHQLFHLFIHNLSIDPSIHPSIYPSFIYISIHPSITSSWWTWILEPLQPSGTWLIDWSREAMTRTHRCSDKLPPLTDALVDEDNT